MIALSETGLGSVHGRTGPAARSAPVAAWLFTVAAFVLAMVVVGGATRLTGSGLSITQWKPLTGALPPLGDAAWQDLFQKYRATSQYRLINQGISLGEFKTLFWWEWAHRLLARGVGLVFIGPFIAFLALRRMPRRLTWPCVGLFALGGLQGLVGWWMVQSGLEGRAAVAPERLAIHLGVALILFIALIWTGLDAWAGPRDPSSARGSSTWGRGAVVLVGAVFLQCLMGALVAGNNAGLVDNDWPLMAGRFVPTDYWLDSLWSTVAHSRAAVQFNHRLAAYAILALAVGLWWTSLRSRLAPEGVRPLATLVVALVFLQATLGVLTLLGGVPLALALAHQANAVLLLAASVALAWRAAHAQTVL